MEDKILNAKEVSKYLNISYWLVTKLAREGKLPHVRLGNKLLFRRSSIDKCLEILESKSINQEL